MLILSKISILGITESNYLYIISGKNNNSCQFYTSWTRTWKFIWVSNSSQSKSLNIICKNHIRPKQVSTHLLKTDNYQFIKYHFSIIKTFTL